MVINTNISAQGSARMLEQSSRMLSKSLARLSSGSKLVSPEDDAAGLAVSMRFDAQINRTEATLNNLGNALSFSQTQDGFLQKIGKALDRMSELAVLAQDVTKADADRGLYNQEFQTLSTYISNAVTKDFNGVSLFSSTALNVTSDSEGSTFQMAGIGADYLTAPTAPSGPVGYAGSTQLGTFTSLFDDHVVNNFPDDFVGLGGGAGDLSSTSTIDDLANAFNGGGWTSASYNSSTGQFTITLGSGEIHDWAKGLRALGFTPSEDRGDHDAFIGAATFSTTLSYTPPPAPTPGAPDISTTSGAASALTTVKSAIAQLATDRATVGASIARLAYTTEQLGTLKENLSAANSRIKDVDVAHESTEFARYNILVQTGTAMLSQANSMPQSVLRLIG